MPFPDSVLYAPIEPGRWSTEVCGGDVRFLKDGRLQQLFVITDYIGSSPSGVRNEWRDVPIVDEGT